MRVFLVGLVLLVMLSLVQRPGAQLAGPEASQRTIDRYIDFYSESGAQHPMERSAANPVSEMQCDADGDGFVDTDEARACYQQHYGTISGGASGITAEQFSNFEDNAAATVSQIDADGDGEISEEEWINWHDERFATDTSASEGRMSAEDYGAWQMGGRTTR